MASITAFYLNSDSLMGTIPVELSTMATLLKFADGRAQNANVSVVVKANTAIEVMIVSPFLLFIHLTVIPTIEIRVLRHPLGAARQELGDTSANTRSNTFAMGCVGVSKAKRKLLDLQMNRSSDAATWIQPVDDGNIELSEIHSSALATVSSAADGGIELSENGATKKTGCLGRGKKQSSSVRLKT